MESHAEVEGDQDDDQIHLIAHLLDYQEEEKVPSEWTRVHSRSEIGHGRAAVFPIGPDLLYDKSVRDALSDQDA